MGENGKDSGVGPDDSQKEKNKVIDEARTKGAKVHFASLMDICHLKNAELEAKHPKYKGRVVLRGDIVKDDSGFLCSIYITRIISITDDSSKSHGYHIQTARVRKTSSWRSICLYQGKNGGCSKIIENSQLGMSRHLDSFNTAQMAKIMVQYGRSSRSSWAKSVRSSFGRTVVWKKPIWENPIEVRLGEGFQLGLLIRSKWRRIILICVCGWHKNWLERNKTLIRCGKYSLKKLIWENQHLSWIMKPGVYSKTMWNRQRYCGQLQNHVRIANFRDVNFKTSVLGKSVFFFVVLRHGRSCQETCGTILWVGKQDDSTTPCIDDHHFTEELKSVGELSKVCSQIVLKCKNLARIGRPDILWSVNKLARSIPKWTKACDKRLTRLISYIHHTCEYKQYCHVGNTAKQCRLGLFQDSDFAGDLWGLKIYIRWSIVRFLEVIHLSQSVGSVRNTLQFRTVQQNQKSIIWMQDWGWMVSPHLILWDLIVTVLGNTSQSHKKRWEPFMNKREVRSTPHTNQKRKQSQGVINNLHNDDFISSNVKSLHQEALLYVFEDNETVIKMIIKGRSPAIRHVSRTHTELLLIGYSIEPIWISKPKSNTLIPRTNSQTYWPKEISHVMNGIIFCVCSTSAISVLPVVLKWCRKERKKIQVKNESQQNRSQRWI